MFERLQGLADEFSEVEASLADPQVTGDSTLLLAATKRYRELTPVVSTFERYKARNGDLAVAREFLAEATTAEDRETWKAEIAETEADIEGIAEELRLLLLPKDPNDGKPVIVEIRGAEGGEEANLFARDLYDMYRGYANRRGWQVEVLGTDNSDLGGLNQVTFMIRGDDAWSGMKYEGGPHRVQRVPVTESQGRIHTSSATVTILAEAEEVDVDIDPNDLQVDVYRSSGAGGQSVNTTDSAVRITHKPTGVVVTMQDERSQLQNKARAMTVLRSRLLKIQQDAQNAQLSAERRAQVGGGGRGEKIRTYNFKENRVTDHRIGFTIYRLADVLLGDLDAVVEALATDERTRQLANEE